MLRSSDWKHGQIILCSNFLQAEEPTGPTYFTTMDFYDFLDQTVTERKNKTKQKPKNKNKQKKNLCKVQSLVYRRYYGLSFYLLWMLTWDCHLRMKAFMGNWRCLRGYSTPMSKLWGTIYPSDSSSGHSRMRTIEWNQQNSVQPSHVVMRNHNIDVNH